MPIFSKTGITEVETEFDFNLEVEEFVDELDSEEIESLIKILKEKGEIQTMFETVKGTFEIEENSNRDLNIKDFVYSMAFTQPEAFKVLAEEVQYYKEKGL